MRSDQPGYSCAYTPSLLPTYTFHWFINEQTNRLDGQVRYTGGSAWVAVGFPAVAGSMVGSTAVIGSSEGVNLYALGGKFPGAVTLLDFSWQTLEGTSYTAANGVSVMSFRKRLNEDQFERPSDQVAIEPNSVQTDMIFAMGSSTNLGIHLGRDGQNLTLTRAGVNASEGA